MTVRTTQRDLAAWRSISSPIYLGGLYNKFWCWLDLRLRSECVCRYFGTLSWFSSFISGNKYSMVSMSLKMLYKSTHITQIVLSYWIKVFLQPVATLRYLFTLRIPAIHDAKFHQNMLLHNVSKIREAFFENLSRDEKSGVKVENRALESGLKLKMSPDA